VQPSCMHDYALLLYALLVRCWNMNKKNGSQHHNNIKYRQVSNLILKNIVEVMSPWLGRTWNTWSLLQYGRLYEGLNLVIIPKSYIGRCSIKFDMPQKQKTIDRFTWFIMDEFTTLPIMFSSLACANNFA